MVQYARADAHYLLYIADRLVSECEMKSHGTFSVIDPFYFKIVILKQIKSGTVHLHMVSKAYMGDLLELVYHDDLFLFAIRINHSYLFLSILLRSNITFFIQLITWNNEWTSLIMVWYIDTFFSSVKKVTLTVFLAQMYFASETKVTLTVF